MSIFNAVDNFLNDQGKRLTNVAQTFEVIGQNTLSAVTFGAVPSAGGFTANTGNVALNTIVETVAEHPFATAAVLAVPASSAARSTIAAGFSELSTGAKLATVLAAPVVAGVVSSNPSAAFKNTITAPSTLANVGKNLGILAQSPTLANAQNLFSENPVATSILGAGAASLIGYGITGTISNILNTEAVKKNTAATLASNNTPSDASSALLGTNKNDVKVAQIRSEAQVEIAKTQAKNTELAVSPIVTTPAAAVPVTTKKKTTKKKKKVVKKKVKPKKKAKSIKKTKKKK
jgi:hypothetical protein